MAHRSFDPDDPFDLADDGAPLPGAPSPAWPRRSIDLGRLGNHPPVLWAIAVAGCAVVAAVGWWLLRPPPAPVETVLPVAGSSSTGAEVGSGDGVPGAGGPAASTTSTTAAPKLVVQAAGSVERPGVYELPSDSRVDDLVRAAGGASGDADLDRVNLAAPLADGERVWVPALGEVEVPTVVAGSTPGEAAPAGESSASASGQPVDLNAATADELDALPGVGPTTAAAILAHRDEIGRFSSVDELLDVRGIGDAKLEQLRPLVRV